MSVYMVLGLASWWNSTKNQEVAGMVDTSEVMANRDDTAVIVGCRDIPRGPGVMLLYT